MLEKFSKIVKFTIKKSIPHVCITENSTKTLTSFAEQGSTQSSLGPS